MSTKEFAVASATGLFDDGTFQTLLTEAVRIPSTSQDSAFKKYLYVYLEDFLKPLLVSMGFVCFINENPDKECGPILTANRIEAEGLPTVLMYGHGDTVRGLDNEWEKGTSPWALSHTHDRYFGRGTADNKGQHLINLLALKSVIAAREGKILANVRVLIETSEELGSRGLKSFVAANKDRLKSDLLLASDGPRIHPNTPTIAVGTRGTYNFDLAVRYRSGGVHSGHWGGVAKDPAIVLANAISSLVNSQGEVKVRAILPSQIPADVRAALANVELESVGNAAQIDADWGEPRLTSAEKIYGWNSLIVLAMTAGSPEAPVSAVPGSALANCQIRFVADTDPAIFAKAVRSYLDKHGFEDVLIENPHVKMQASRTAIDNPWVSWARESLEQTLKKTVTIIPSTSGALPGDVFASELGIPLVWVPHSYNGCKQHGPNEHLLFSTAREGLAAFAGLWWDLAS